jgi:hypothetical protein
VDGMPALVVLDVFTRTTSLKGGPSAGRVCFLTPLLTRRAERLSCTHSITDGALLVAGESFRPRNPTTKTVKCAQMDIKNVRQTFETRPRTVLIWAVCLQALIVRRKKERQDPSLPRPGGSPRKSICRKNCSDVVTAVPSPISCEVTDHLAVALGGGAEAMSIGDSATEDGTRMKTYSSP